MSTVYLIAGEKSPVVDFGIEELRSALADAGFASAGPQRTLTGRPDRTPCIELRLNASASNEQNFVAGADGRDTARYVDESFHLHGRGDSVTVIEAGHPRGLLYGALELADMVRAGEWADAEIDVTRSPAMRVRGVKFNLPYEPYTDGDPFRENLETCMDLAFWTAFIDELARNRYNCLSLWSLHPFHLLVSSPRFRDANPFSDAEIERHEEFFHALFGHALSRGIDVFLFTWNIYLPAPVAKGLGLPTALSNGSEGKSETNRWDAARGRQRAPIVSEYVEEMVYRVLTSYPELAGLGTSASEAMTGEGSEKEQWVVDTYLRAIERSGRRVKFIHRTNMQSARDIEQLARPQIDANRFYYSWKYSNAHAYSSPRPVFEQLWGAWEGVDLDTTQILFTVRNDDVHTHRWADADYVREYVEGIAEKEYAHGFYWGADAYLWGRDFQHVDHGHKAWKWDFERHRQQFALWGRIAFDPDVSARHLDLLWDRDFGADAAAVRQGLVHASRVIPAVNRLAWRNYDFEWHPEACLSDTGFRTVLDFMVSSPMPGAGVVGLADFAHGVKPLDGQETPESIIELLRAESTKALSFAQQIEERATPWREPHTECALLDLRSMAALGRYYAAKIQGALELARYADTGNEEFKTRAVDVLNEAIAHWEAIGYYWGQHNRPYEMVRIKRTFGYPFYLGDVRADVELARQLEARG